MAKIRVLSDDNAIVVDVALCDRHPGWDAHYVAHCQGCTWEDTDRGEQAGTIELAEQHADACRVGVDR